LPPAVSFQVAPSSSKLSDAIIALLPEDGSPVLNRVMQVMLSQRFGRSITQDEYFAARDELFKKEMIGRLRGQGGVIFLARHDLPEDAEHGSAELHVDPREFWTEAQLMVPLRKYLDSKFRKGLDLPPDALCIVNDTSRIGAPKGRWTRPDFILVSAMRFKLVPGVQVDVHSFELKTETGVDNLAVYEALAQAHSTNFGHLVWHLPKGSDRETALPEIKQRCDAHGIGLIRMLDPTKPETTEIVVDPVRKASAPALVNSFLELRLNDSEQESLSREIAAAR
jgi:hypothetical protein